MNKNNNSLITSNIIVSVQIYPIRSFKKKKNLSKAQVQIRSIQCNYYSFKFHLIYRFPSLSFILAIAIKILLKKQFV